MRKKLIINIFLLSLSLLSFGQKQIDGKADKSEYMIGDRIEYSFRVDKVKEKTVISTDYAFSDTLNIISERKDTSDGGITYSFVFASFVGGDVTLPRYTVSEEQSLKELFVVNPPAIKINLPQIDTVNIEVKELKSIQKVPVTFKEVLPISILVVGIAVLIILVYFLVKYIKKRREHRAELSVRKAELIPEDIEAINALKTLKDAHYVESNQVKQHYVLLTDIMWKYICRRFGINAFEMTSSQILGALEKESVPFSNIEQMRYLFSVADFVKFAKHLPSIEENLNTMQMSFDFVNDTKRQPVAETDEKNEEVKP